MAKAKDSSADAGAKSDNKDNVTVGEKPKVDATEQAMAARGEDKKAEDKGAAKVDSGLVKKGEEFLSDEQKRQDVITEGRLAESERTGDYAAVPDPGAGHFKVGETKETKKYAGWLTCTGVSHEDGKEISALLHIPEDSPVTEEGVFYRFKCHHDSAMREPFKIDETNTDDPLLRTAKG